MTENRIPLKLGEQTLGWVYWVIPSEDFGDASDYTQPVGIYVPKQTNKK